MRSAGQLTTSEYCKFHFHSMSYEDRYHDRAEVLSYMAWYNVKELSKAIREIRNINFSIVEKRQQALQRLGNLPSDAPYDRDRRFPGAGYYVCEGVGDWNRKIQQLKSALSFKSHDKDEKTKTDQPKSAIDDASQAFWNATGDIINQIIRKDDLFDRRGFELMCRWRANVPAEEQEEEANLGGGGAGGGNQGQGGGGGGGDQGGNGGAGGGGDQGGGGGGGGDQDEDV